MSWEGGHLPSTFLAALIEHALVKQQQQQQVSREGAAATGELGGSSSNM